MDETNSASLLAKSLASFQNFNRQLLLHYHMKVVVVEEEKPLITSVATSSSLSYEDDPLDNLGPVWYSSSS
jgi:hypothetical protein